MEKAFYTANPQEADSLEEKLGNLSIDFHVEEEIGESGLSGFTFFVSSENLNAAIQRAKVIRARSLSEDPDIEDYSDASEVLREHNKAESKRIQEISAPALLQTIWKFRHRIAVAFIPITLPVGHWIQNRFIFSSDVRIDTTIAYSLSLGIVMLLLTLLYFLLEPKSGY